MLPPVSVSFADPERAPVRPRVTVAGGFVARLLEEEVAELLGKGERVTVRLLGSPGSGRTTALIHLAATFRDPRLGVRDTDGAGSAGDLVKVVAADPHDRGDIDFELAAWSSDDVLEYLAHMHPGTAADAFAAWRRQQVDHDLGRWPGLCRAVLDHLAARRADEVLAALRLVFAEQLPGSQRHLARVAALRHCTADSAFATRSPVPGLPLLGAPIVRALLAAEHMLQLVEGGEAVPLAQLHWSQGLVLALRSELDSNAARADRLVDLCRHAAGQHLGSTLSILCASRPGFRPPFARVAAVPHSHFVGADLSGLELRGSLDSVNLTAADLRLSDLENVSAHGARFCRARLDGARLDRMQGTGLDGSGLVAPNASLRQCNLRGADLRSATFDGASLREAVLAHVCLDGASLRNTDLTRAHLMGASLHGADLRDATCTAATLAGLDLRAARLEGATFELANLSRSELSNTVLPGLHAERANFHGATLTGARWPGAKLRSAAFVDAGLADVDWEGADLRDCDFTHAAFHLGSARSGLVDSTIASEGTRTGFYTDESLEETFQAPEDVRKANLCRCDLRGARLDGCDFYLVDLRGALLDPPQTLWLRRCRAILDPRPASS